MAAHFPAPSPITSPDIVGRPTLWFAWCRSGTDQSSRRLRLGRRRSSKLPATPCSFGSPLASSEFESNWRERKLLDWIWVFDRWWCLQTCMLGEKYHGFENCTRLNSARTTHRFKLECEWNHIYNDSNTKLNINTGNN
ncbi:uncharacterized protein LOC122027498 [Zingiber officinale]|uniref:uncharacterized protein LOC122027498 n=1 Tax=Zingiber officinale TaxID=94328 RepID=UPI001C4A7B89|nr:uncharacterized protein LOC122027498 [Zingiber officinale]